MLPSYGQIHVHCKFIKCFKIISNCFPSNVKLIFNEMKHALFEANELLIVQHKCIEKDNCLIKLKQCTILHNTQYKFKLNYSKRIVSNLKLLVFGVAFRNMWRLII